ncbi:MAG: alpha/beta hydrolase-fold protein [Candidatus Electryonea clarkiae]|nr:alpha/beta hydrolase-fold protein [Candidatus Electryonea clarkiae]MDP8285232.1 alpha/beta hydrolase-fold protein [Candidatus Electryonea clarkiae]
MRKLLTLIALIAMVAALLVGCASENEAPTAPSIDKGTIVPVADAFATALNGGAASNYYVYTPPGYSASGDPYPVLYLLHGFGGDENYWTALFSATDAADWLIEEGEIDPMVIVMPNGKNLLGGSFYTDNLASVPVNASETHILGIIAEVEAAYNVETTPVGKAIGGHSMGGFGAVSIALNNAGVFGAVSALAAPISFWGTRTAPPHDDMTYKGIEEVLPAVLLETGFDPATEGAAEYKAKMYPSPDRRLTSMIFAMAAAFSPTEFDLSSGSPIPQYVETTIDSIIVGVDDNGVPIKSPMWVDLPIGLDGEAFMTTWTRWLAYDPVSRFAGGQAANLAGVKVYLDAGLDDDLGLFGAHQVFAGALAAAGMTVDTESYYDGVMDSEGTDIAADHTTHTFERVKKMLKWHSDNF